MPPLILLWTEFFPILRLENIYMIDCRGLEISIIKWKDEILAVLEKERR